MKDTFRYFLRKNFPDVEVTNEQADGLCEAFDAYLEEKLKPETRAKIVPKSPQEVIMNMDNPLRRNGFHPALLIHFSDFIAIVNKQING